MNIFLVYSLICITFVPNSWVLELLPLWLGLTVSDLVPLRVMQLPTLFSRIIALKMSRVITKPVESHHEKTCLWGLRPG